MYRTHMKDAIYKGTPIPLLNSAYSSSKFATWCADKTQARNSAVKMNPADRKSTRLNSSHGSTSYAVFCLKKKTGGTGGNGGASAGGGGGGGFASGGGGGCGNNGNGNGGGGGGGSAYPGGIVFFFNDTATTEIYTLSLHDALPI